MLKKFLFLIFTLTFSFSLQAQAQTDETVLKISWNETITVTNSQTEGYYHYENKKKHFAFDFPKNYELKAIYRSSFEEWRREGLTLVSPDEIDPIIIDTSYLKRVKASPLKKSYNNFLKDKSYEIISSKIYDTFYEIEYINLRTKMNCYTKRYVAKDGTLSFIQVTYSDAKKDEAKELIEVIKTSFFPGW